MTVPARVNLYRKYRPQRFSELAGQEHISKTIQSAVAAGRIAHAYMFSGPRGIGKTSIAKILAKTINCENLNNLKPCVSTLPISKSFEQTATIFFIGSIEYESFIFVFF